jgi:hypothetical protein
MEILAEFSDCFATSVLVCSLVAVKVDWGLAPCGALVFSVMQWSAVAFGRGA